MNLENYFISQFKDAHIGDDGALIDNTVYSKDAFFENVHFKTSWMSHYQIASKAMIINISDAFAMNAVPKYALLSVAMSKDITKAQMRELACGFQDTAAKYGIKIIGGDTISNIKLDITVTIISKTLKPLMRKGLRLGHLIAYSGKLGRSSKELKKLMNLGKIHKKSKFVDIKLRDKFIHQNRRFLSCGMDISDGLFSDLEKLSSANRLGFKFKSPIPKRVGCSGEEYEMLFGFDARDKKAILRHAAKTRTPITIIGKCVRKTYKNRCKAHHF
ncbi:MAG: thiamine-monophosphate kinase [Campylobacterota bacterium]|nr:thiamine-monophosphate kinase [Campylobacterota bacterium]MDQ1338311.1 thiamine-monophosphate kinase [Campylobacterota bacterium]